MIGLTSQAGSGATPSEVLDILLLRSGVNAANVLLGATTLGAAAGLIGAFALLRKRSLMTDAVAHSTLPGICVAFLLADAAGLAAKSLPVLLGGAAATACLGALCVHLIGSHTRLREDAATALVLSVFFGAGVVLLSMVPRITTTPAGGLNSFIYGQAAAVQRAEVVMIACIASGALAVTLLLLKPLTLLSFNDEFAESLGWPVRALDLGLLGLIVLVTIAGLQSVGLIMVVALLIIPAAAARFWTDRLWRMLAASVLIGALSGYAGAAVSAALPNRPAGAVIVLAAGVLFAISMLLAPRRGVLAEAARRLRVHLRIAGEHALEMLHERGGPVSGAALASDRGLSRLHAAIVLGSLRAGGLVRRSDGRYALTPAGAREGARIARNHRIWAAYLVRHADIAPSHVDWSVDRVEHVLGEDVVAEIERELGNGSPASGVSP